MTGGQGRVLDRENDKRFADNRPGPTGQGRVSNRLRDQRIAANREGPNGQGRVKRPDDKRLLENRGRS